MILLEAINGKEKKEFDLIEGYEEITWAMANKLAALDATRPKFLVELVETLTGIPSDWWRDFEDVAQYMTIEAYCTRVFSEWVQVVNSLPAYRPANIEVEGKTISFAEEVLHESAGQYMDALSLWSQFSKQSEHWPKVGDTPIPPLTDALALYGKIFRIYASSQIHGSYSFTQAMAINLDEVKATHVLAWAAFFLGRLIKLRTGTMNSVKEQGSHKKKKRQGLGAWLRSSVSSSRWTA